MQRLGSIVMAWATGGIMMVLNWLNIKLTFICTIFSQFNPGDPEDWESLTGILMNIAGFMSFAVGIYLALRYKKSNEKGFSDKKGK